MTRHPGLAGKHCLVLGGGGFIGTNLCLALRDLGAEVVGFGRRPRFRHAGLGELRWIEGDFSDPVSLGRATETAEVVFHLIAGTLPAQSNLDPAETVRTDVANSIRLLQLCRSNGVGKVVFVSSGGTVYGRSGPVSLTEDAPTDPISSYGIGKLMVEKYLALFEYLHGLEHVVLRVANPFGPFQSPDRPQGVVGALLSKALRRQTIEIWGDGSVVRDFIYIGDVIEALLAAATYAGRERVFNIGSGEGRSLREVIQSVELVVAQGPLDLSFKPARDADVPVNVLNIERARRELSWKPETDWMTGLSRTTKWMKNQLELR